MAYAFVQQKQNSAGATPTTTISTGNLGSNPVAGNMFWWVVNYDAASLQTVSIADTALNTFTQIGSVYSAAFSEGFHWGYAKNISGGIVDAALVTFGGAVTFPAVYIAEYSGLDTAAPFTIGEFAQQFQTAPGAGTDQITSGNTPSLSTQPDALIGFVFDNDNSNTFTAGTSFNSRGAVWDYAGGAGPSFGFAEDRRLTATTAVAATATSTGGAADHYFALAAVFKEATGGAALDDDGDFFQFIQAA